MTSEPTTTTSTETFTAANRTLNTPKIIGLIIGAMTPLAVLVGTIPLGMALGGPSILLSFIAVGIIVGIFCVGYSKMVQRINRPGAFYNYIARGLGRPTGVGAAMVAAIAYPLGIIGSFAVNSVILQGMVVALFGVELPWQFYVVLSFVIVAVISYFGIDLSALVVFVVVVVEVVAVAVFAIAIGATDGIGAFSLDVFSPQVLQIGAPAVAFIFALLCFQGYEAGALYAPEAKRPEKTVPRALFVALVILVVVHVVASWSLIAAGGGIATVADDILSVGIGEYVFSKVALYMGTGGVIFFAIATLLSVMAIQIAIINFMSRYIYTLACEDLLPRYLAKRNRFDAPGAAIITLSLIGLIVIFGSTLFGLDPLTQVSSVAFGIGAVCATVLMAAASIAVVAYFARRPKEERRLWSTIVAPAAAAVLLVGALVVQIAGFSNITGSEEPWMMALPFIVLLIGVLGVLFGFWIKKNRPRTYTDLAAGDTAEEAAALRTDRIRIVQEERARRAASRR